MLVSYNRVMSGNTRLEEAQRATDNLPKEEMIEKLLATLALMEA